MKKWYQGIVVEHKEIDNKTYHCFNEENFKILVEERKYQLKEIERLHSIIKEVREYIEKMTYDNPDTYFELEVNTVLGNVLEILDKEIKE